MNIPKKDEIITAIKVLRWYADELGGAETGACSFGMELVDFIADRLECLKDGKIAMLEREALKRFGSDTQN